MRWLGAALICLSSTAHAQFFNLSAGQERTGYFVMTDEVHHGNFGGRAGAANYCVQRLSVTTWRGKNSQNLNIDKVRAFLCDSTGCGNFLPNTLYAFAVAGNLNVGGAGFRANSAGLGPSDVAYWSSPNYFGGSFTYWSGRSAGSGSLMANTTTGNHCQDWSSTGFIFSYLSTYGQSNSSGAGRWSQGTAACSVEDTYRLICIVDP